MTKSKIPPKAGKLLILVVLLFVGIPAFAQVDTAWVRRYNGPGNGQDEAYAISVDASGNVYVTGYSYGSGTDEDYATIKYYPNGDTAWVRRYNGPSFEDIASAIAVDDSGNVYVTGWSSHWFASFAYATIKYYPNGDTAWVRRYGSDETRAFGIAVDDSGNVYVGGRLSWDYGTIKYYPDGDTAWVRRYDGPTNSWDWASAIAIDISGNVYVTGCSEGSGYDYATIKYYSNGDTAWVRRYNGPGNGNDWGQDIGVDDSGNAYVAGYSSGSATYGDYATIKYDPDGNELWVRRYNGPGNSEDRAFAIAVDGSGSCYVTGWSYSSESDYDYATIKYYPNGDTAWVRRYNGPGNSADSAFAIAVDDSKNVYVTGRSYGSGTDRDYATIKYYPTGDMAWVTRYNGPGNSLDGARAIAVDGSGNIYVTGRSEGTGSYQDYATIKYVQGGGPSFDVAVEIKEDELATWNAIPTTHWFVLPLSVMNNGPVTLHDVEVTLNIAGNIFNHTISSLNPGQEKVIRDSVDIPRIWENKNVIGSVTSIEGYPVGIHDSKEVSVYYCAGGTDAHPFTIFRDFYNFPNPDFDWGEFREAFQFFSEFQLSPDFILSLLPEPILIWTGHCVGMSGTASAYFLDPSLKPPPFKETREMNLSDEGVFPNIIRYQLHYFVTDQLFKSFLGTQANEAEESAKTLIVDNFTPIVFLRHGLSSHAVMGYKLLQDNTLQNSVLYLYDNEFPDHVSKAYFNLNNNTFDYPDWNTIRVSQPLIAPLNVAEWLSGLFDWWKHQILNLWDSGLARFGLGCPAKMLLTDEYGRRVGFVDGISFVNEIPEAEVIFMDGGNGDTLFFYDVPKDLNYTVNYFGWESGHMDAEVLKPKSEETAITLSYVDVEVTPDMIATLLVDSTYDHTLKIDYDGNGTIDTVVNPTVDNLPPASFNLLSPLDQEIVFPYPLVFSWSSSSDLNGDTISYRVYIDTDSSFSSPDSSESLTDTSWTCTIPLQDSTTYFWKIKAFDNRGGVTFSQETWSFFSVSSFTRGDANGDGVINIADVVHLINYLFKGGPPPQPWQAGDANCDGVINSADVVYLINYLFKNGPPPSC